MWAHSPADISAHLTYRTHCQLCPIKYLFTPDASEAFKGKVPCLKVWSTVKIRGTRVPQNAIVPVGRPRPYSMIMLNMRFIPKASLRASSQITATSYILERHLWVSNSKLLSLDPTWSLGCKQTDCITGVISKLVDPKPILTPVNAKHLYDFIQCWANVEDVGPTMYKCYTNMLCLLGRWSFFQT